MRDYFGSLDVIEGSFKYFVENRDELFETYGKLVNEYGGTID
ncbi:hypothetical protein [Gottschalkia acidurici]|nr:hypothetical protein [Gottschalkia acidurici]